MSVELSANSFLYVVKGVSVPGVAEQLVEHFIPQGMDVVLTARLSNTGVMYVANTQTNAQTAGNRKNLESGQSTALRIDNTNRIWVDADNASDRLEVTVQKAA